MGRTQRTRKDKQLCEKIKKNNLKAKELQIKCAKGKSYNILCVCKSCLSLTVINQKGTCTNSVNMCTPVSKCKQMACKTTLKYLYYMVCETVVTYINYLISFLELRV